MTSPPESKDNWSPTAYTASASFVPQLAQKVTQLLSPQSTDSILDIGCGDGVLTARIKDHCAYVSGIDASPNLIVAAKKNYGHIEALDWQVSDCRYLEMNTLLRDAQFDKAFSNAALHWILRDASTRMSVLRGVHRVLKPGGSIVFEMGGAGNVADVHSALLAALVHQGVSIERAREACPWYFPSEKLMGEMLKEVGFKVEKSELEYRPTRLTTDKEGGLGGWVRLMGAQFLEILEDVGKREAVVREVCDVLETVITHEEDGSMWLGYVRLRVLAMK